MSHPPSVVSDAASRGSLDSRRSTNPPPSSITPFVNESTGHFAHLDLVPSRSSSLAGSVQSSRDSSKSTSVHTYVDDYYHPTELPPLIEEEEPEEQPVEQSQIDIKSQFSEDRKPAEPVMEDLIMGMICNLPRVYPPQPKRSHIEELLTDLHGLDVVQEHLDKEKEATFERSYRDV